MQPSIVWSQSATYLVVSAKLSNMQKTLVSRKCLCNCHSTSAVVGSVAFEKQVRKGYKLQNCSGHCRMSSFLKDPQCVAVRTGKHCSKTTAVLPLTQRVDRLQSYHIFLSSDEPMLAVLCCSRAPQAVLQGGTPESTGEARCSTGWSMASAG